MFTKKNLPYAFLMLALLTSACAEKADTSNDLVKLEITNAPGSLIVLREGETTKVEVSLLPATADKNALKFTYTSSDDNVFSIDKSGVITAGLAGDASLHIMTHASMLVRTGCSVKVIRQDAILATALTVADDAKTIVMGKGTTYDMASKVELLPENATIKDLSYVSSNAGILSVTNSGEVTALSKGTATITASTLDGSRKSATTTVTVKEIVREEHDRSSWVLSWAYTLKYTDSVNPTGDQNAIIDGNLNTCSILIKPGKTFGGVTAPLDKPSFFVVDMGEPVSVQWIYWRDRNASGTAANGSIGLRVRGFSLLGSDDGIEFTNIYTESNVPFVEATVEHTYDIPAAKYRYYKFNLDLWDTSVAGNTVQMSEFKLGKFEMVD